MNKARPFLLSITLYSVLVLQFVLFVATTALVLFKSEMEELQLFVYSDISQMQSHWVIYFALILILFSIFSIIQMLRQKKYGVYLFSIFSIIIIVIILMGRPIEFLNIFMLLMVNYVFYMYHSWFSLHAKMHDEENDQESESA